MWNSYAIAHHTLAKIRASETVKGSGNSEPNVAGEVTADPSRGRAVLSFPASIGVLPARRESTDTQTGLAAGSKVRLSCAMAMPARAPVASRARSKSRPVGLRRGRGPVRARSRRGRCRG